MAKYVHRVASTALAFATLSALGCGKPGAAGEVARPDPPKVQETLCDSVADFGQPLIVDLKAHERAVYEAVMKDGVAVVRYDCSQLRILKDCKLEGDYGFIGLSPKEELVRLEGADEIRLNLPSFGARVAAEVSRDASLDLGMIMIGMRRTTVHEADRKRLSGSGCDKATHFVRGAFVGAFALKQGSSGKVAGALEVFGAGTSTSSSSSKRTENRDGDAEACKKLDPKSESPDERCGALLRLELTAIDVTPQENVGTVDVCPKDLVLVEGKCAPPTTAAAFQCREGQREECAAQCDKGHAGSCAALGFMYFGSHGVSADPEKAATLSAKACEGGSARGCSNLGHAYERGEALPKDLGRARELYEKGCTGGFPRGCTNLGVLSEDAGDPARANTLYDRGCEGGDARGCHYLAVNLDKGDGIAADPERAHALFARACLGKFGDSCALLASQLVGGTEKERDKGVKDLEASCAQGTASACRFLGGLRLSGTKLARDPAKALRDFERGCEAKDAASCVDAAEIALRGSDGVNRDAERGAKLAKRACDAKHSPGCRLVAVAHLQGTGMTRDDAAALKLLEKSCVDGDGESCAGAGLLYRHGYGTGRNPALATGLFEKSCQGRFGYGCALLAAARLDGVAGARNDSGSKYALSRACSYGYSPACGLTHSPSKFYPVTGAPDPFSGKNTTAAAAPPKKTSAAGSRAFSTKKTAAQKASLSSELEGVGAALSSSGPSTNPALEERRAELVKRAKGKLGAIKACPKAGLGYEQTLAVGFSVDTEGQTLITGRPYSGLAKLDACATKAVKSIKLGRGEHVITGTMLVRIRPKGDPGLDLQIAPDPSEFTLPLTVRRMVGCACGAAEVQVVCAAECRSGPAPQGSWAVASRDGYDSFNFTTAAAAAAEASAPQSAPQSAPGLHKETTSALLKRLHKKESAPKSKPKETAVERAKKRKE